MHAPVANRVETDLAGRLAQFAVPYTREFSSNWFSQLVAWVAPALIFVGVWYWLLGRAGTKQGIGGLTAIGKSRAKELTETRC